VREVVELELQRLEPLLVLFLLRDDLLPRAGRILAPMSKTTYRLATLLVLALVGLAPARQAAPPGA
jgi:hypothetical protein